MVSALAVVLADGVEGDRRGRTGRPSSSYRNCSDPEAGVPLTFTGRIEAEDEVVLAFRISGRLLENNGKIQNSGAGRWGLLADFRQAIRTRLRQAQAGLAAAQGQDSTPARVTL